MKDHNAAQQWDAVLTRSQGLNHIGQWRKLIYNVKSASRAIRAVKGQHFLIKPWFGSEVLETDAVAEISEALRSQIHIHINSHISSAAP